VTRALLVVALAGACSKQAAKPAELPAACVLVDRAITVYQTCRRTRPGTFSAEALDPYRRDLTRIWHEVATRGAWKAARMCSFEIDDLRADMAGEDCVLPMTDADRAVIAEARVRVTPAPRASNAENQRIVDAYVVEREATCACADKACVDAAAKVGALPLEKLQIKSPALHDELDAISVETYHCATRTSIISPERWQRVK